MSLILCIETGTEMCSVCLSRDGVTLAQRESCDTRAHAQHLAVFVDEVLSEEGITASDLSAVAVSMGPGSYTGLRIGSSLAKGICYATGIPLLAVATLDAMTAGLIEGAREGIYPITLSSTSKLIPMLDARRMEVYTAVYDSKGTAIEPIRAEVLTSDSFEAQREDDLIIYGTGAFKCEGLIRGRSVNIVKFSPSATHMVTLAHDMYNKKEYRDIAYFEPFYLKDFVSTTRKESLLERVSRKK